MNNQTFVYYTFIIILYVYMYIICSKFTLFWKKCTILIAYVSVYYERFYFACTCQHPHLT